MLNLIVATGNRHKMEEMRSYLNIFPIILTSMKDFAEFPEIEETGQTFEENVKIKALTCFDFFKHPVLADDSGLQIPALDNEPGVFSARYAGLAANDRENNRFLLQRMKDLKEEDRKARFNCTICFKDDQFEEIFTGITEGIILKDYRGRQGFGYDPLFYIPELGKTYAELTTEQKNAYSHRGKALQKLVKFLKQKRYFDLS